jgi:hypothetical protein
MKKQFFFFALLILSFMTHETVLSQNQKTDNELVNELISKKRQFNKTFGYGFRIQLYNGFEVEAKKIRAKFRIDFPEIRTYLTYKQPEWKIRIGFYKTKLEADKVLLDLELKKKYGAGVIVIPLGK